MARNRASDLNNVAYVCEDYCLRRKADGIGISYRGSYVGSAPSVRLAKKRIRRNRRSVPWRL